LAVLRPALASGTQTTVISSPLFPPAVRTLRLLLRRQHPDDAALIKEAVDTSLHHLRASVAWPQAAPEALPVLEARLAASAAAFDAGDDWTFSILDQASTRVLGGVGLHRPEAALITLVGPGALEAGYWLRADATGHGYATEATACLVELAFDRLRAQRIVICHDPSNASSEGVPRRLGFRCLGTVSAAVLPGRQAADGSIRPETKLWIGDAPAGRGPDTPSVERGSSRSPPDER
jgi:ribosomal-protein-serine acetyltransferase